MQDFRNLEVWYESRRLTVAIYAVLRTFPRYEQFALCDQMRRSVTGIGTAIVESFGRATRTDAVRVLQSAITEGAETYHHLYTSLDLGYIAPETFSELEAQIDPLLRRIRALLLAIRPEGRKRRHPRRSGDASGRRPARPPNGGPSAAEGSG